MQKFKRYLQRKKLPQKTYVQRLRQLLFLLSWPLRAYANFVTLPVPYLLYFQLVTKDFYPKIEHQEHNCIIKEIKIPIIGDKNQKLHLEGITITPLAQNKDDLPYRTMIYTPGSFAMIKQNCITRLLKYCEYFKVRIIMFNNEGCGNSEGQKQSLQGLKASYVKAINHITRYFKLKLLHIWSHSNGAYLHLSTLKQLAKTIPKSVKFGTQVLDRTHKKSDYIGPNNFVINSLATLTICFTVTLTLYPLLKLYLSNYTLDLMLQYSFVASFCIVTLSSLFPRMIGKHIWYIFSYNSRLDNVHYAKDALSSIPNPGRIISIAHEADEIICGKARFNANKLNTPNRAVECKHIEIPAVPNPGSTPRDPCDINHNLNLCGEMQKNNPKKSLLEPILEAIDKSVKSVTKTVF